MKGTRSVQDTEGNSKSCLIEGSILLTKEREVGRKKGGRKKEKKRTKVKTKIISK